MRFITYMAVCTPGARLPHSSRVVAAQELVSDLPSPVVVPVVFVDFVASVKFSAQLH